PFGPISPVTEPVSTSSEAPSTAWTPPNVFTTSCTSSSAVMRAQVPGSAAGRAWHRFPANDSPGRARHQIRGQVPGSAAGRAWHRFSANDSPGGARHQSLEHQLLLSSEQPLRPPDDEHEDDEPDDDQAQV